MCVKEAGENWESLFRIRKLRLPGYWGGLCKKAWQVACKRPICSFMMMLQFLTMSSFRMVRKCKCKLAGFLLPLKPSQRNVSIIWVWRLFASVVPLLVLCKAIKIICWSFFTKRRLYCIMKCLLAALLSWVNRKQRLIFSIRIKEMLASFLCTLSCFQEVNRNKIFKIWGVFNALKL